MAAGLEPFFRLHRSRAEKEGTITHKNVFESPEAEHFLVEVSERLARRGMTRIFQLKIAGEVVATRIGYVMGKSIYLYYSGYDPKWGPYSIMTTVVAEALKWAMANGLTEANLSTGNDVSKTRWGPREVVYREGIQVAPGLRPKLAWDGWQLALKARDNEKLKTMMKRYLGR